MYLFMGVSLHIEGFGSTDTFCFVLFLYFFFCLFICSTCQDECVLCVFVLLWREVVPAVPAA